MGRITVSATTSIFTNEFIRWEPPPTFPDKHRHHPRSRQRICRKTWRDIVGDMRELEQAHEDQVLAMVRCVRLGRARDYGIEMAAVFSKHSTKFGGAVDRRCNLTHFHPNPVIG